MPHSQHHQPTLDEIGCDPDYFLGAVTTVDRWPHPEPRDLEDPVLHLIVHVDVHRDVSLVPLTPPSKPTVPHPACDPRIHHRALTAQVRPVTLGVWPLTEVGEELTAAAGELAGQPDTRELDVDALTRADEETVTLTRRQLRHIALHAYQEGWSTGHEGGATNWHTHLADIAATSAAATSTDISVTSTDTER